MTTGNDTSETETHRLTPTQRLHEVTMAALHRKPAEPINEVSITRNAKGAVQIEVTVRGVNAGDCADTARTLYDQLAGLYPYLTEPNGRVNP